MEDPLCRECRKYDRLTEATEVDHIIPMSQGGQPLDRNNLQGLCASCHGKKSNIESKI